MSASGEKNEAMHAVSQVGAGGRREGSHQAALRRASALSKAWTTLRSRGK